MIINFYPEHNNTDFEEAAKVYTKIWSEEGDGIVEAIEKISTLKFKEKTINALVYDGSPYSYPLLLKAGGTLENKKAMLIHELCHYVIVGNGIEVTSENDYKKTTTAFHKQVDLILYDIWELLYGQGFANTRIEYEVSLWTGKGVSPYKIAWDWALKMTKEQRQKEFKKYLPK